MYEILKQYEYIGERIISLDGLKELLGIDISEYPRYNNFRQIWNWQKARKSAYNGGIHEQKSSRQHMARNNGRVIFHRHNGIAAPVLPKNGLRLYNQTKDGLVYDVYGYSIRGDGCNPVSYNLTLPRKGLFY